MVSTYGTLTHALTYDPKGTMLATIGDDGAIRVWDAVDGALQPSLAQTRMGQANAIAYSLPSGLLIAAANADHNIYLWTTKRL